MSAITGYIGRGAPEKVKRMCGMMSYRGPDGEGFYEDENNGVALGHGRLACAKQPLLSEDSALVAVCDGNDAQIILDAYQKHGDECVKFLRGGFAFAIWDARRRRVFFARDHIGLKPFCFAANGGEFVFASEPKAVRVGVADSGVDLEALWHYMSLRYMPDDRSLFAGVSKLQAAHCGAFENGAVRVWRYWKLDAFGEKRKGTDAELTDELEQVLLKAVRAQMNTEAPWGAFLSGGIDSSLVTAMAAKISGKPFHTFSIGVKEQDINELPWARMVSEKYGLIAREEIVEADLARKIQEMIRHMDEPADPFGVGVYLVSQVAAKDVKVALTGDGGDENFAGYDRFAGQRFAQIYSLVPRALRKHVLGRAFGMVPETFGYKSVASKLKWLNEMSFYNDGERYVRSMSFLRFTEEGKEALFTPEARAKIADSDSVGKILAFYNDGAARSLLDKMLYTDLMTRMPDHLLPITDRMSMAHSIETRAPLIDLDVTEFAASLPERVKLRGGGKGLKWILREVARRYLPRELIDRPKQGFGFPLARWLRSDLREFMRELLCESGFAKLGIFDQREINRLMDEHTGGKADHNFRLWILINLEIWLRQISK
ncbi:MAG: asparagine synthase (glutamine-hydrolyzing) [Kiritimatiellaeota bacterium]|nr:asparagine synthase (glutamine-hydrolyzing) [Kiritimatiellota bacterium]